MMVEPRGRELVEKVAMPFVNETGVWAMPPTEKVTVPVGVAPVPETVAVKVTAPPGRAGLESDDTVVVVRALDTW